MPRTSIDLPEDVHDYLHSQKDRDGKKIPFWKTVTELVRAKMKKDKK